MMSSQSQNFNQEPEINLGYREEHPTDHSIINIHYGYDFGHPSKLPEEFKITIHGRSTGKTYAIEAVKNGLDAAQFGSRLESAVNKQMIAQFNNLKDDTAGENR